MIKNLLIKNFAIIEEISIDFDPGLTVITGETGSGKSIIIEALSVSAGKKTDRMMIKSGTENSIIDLDFIGESYRRIISKSGRSKSYINEIPMSINDLTKEFEHKIDFHGQHDQQLILKKENHINYLDYYCNHQNKVDEIMQVFVNLEKSKKQMDQLKQNLSLYEEKKELLHFQLNEIELADIKIEDEAKLINEYKKLNHIEEILTFFNFLKLKLNNHDEGIISNLNSILSKIDSLKKYDENISNFEEQFNSVVVQLQDIDSEIESRLSSDEIDKTRLSFIEERISVLESLKRKYGGSIESVFENRDLMRKELAELSSFVKSDKDLSEKIEDLEKKYNKLAIELSINRKNKSKILSRLIENSLGDLNMNGAKFSINISQKFKENSFISFNNEPIQHFSKGFDEVEFLLSANPGEPLKPMASIASGGEMSRIMLAIKTVFQDQNPVSTLVFDEIDTGISGETAQKVSNHLKKLSKHKQIICITHLPQIAKKADKHLHITKSVKDSHTTVNAEYLDGDFSKEVINNLFIGDEVIA
jgi:DNA repair protein RecN (Recombination protein N)